MLNILALIGTVALFAFYCIYDYFIDGFFLVIAGLGLVLCIVSLHYVSKAGIAGSLLILAVMIIMHVGSNGFEDVPTLKSFVSPLAFIMLMLGPLAFYLISDVLASQYEKLTGKVLRVIDLNKLND